MDRVTESRTEARVLHLDTGREWRGGQQQVLYLVRGVVDAGVPCTILCPKGSPLAGRARADGLQVRETTYHGVGDPIAIRNVVQAIVDTEATILHTHSPNAHSLGFLAMRWPGLPKDRRPAMIVHRRVDFPPATDPITRMRYTSDSALFLCVSNAVRAVLLKNGVPESRLRVIPSCIDASRIDALGAEDRDELRRRLGIPEGRDVIGSVGALVPHKGHKYLLAAMPKILGTRPAAMLVLFGDGPLEAELRRESWERGLQDRVLFANPGPEVERYLRCIDLLAHPSTEEGLGTTILDAMAARLPVVASRAGGIPEVVQHGVTGWLVPPGAPSELAGAIISLLEDPRRRAQFGESGRARVETEFPVARMRNSVLACYDEVLASSPSTGTGTAPLPASGGKAYDSEDEEPSPQGA